MIYPIKIYRATQFSQTLFLIAKVRMSTYPMQFCDPYSGYETNDSNTGFPLNKSLCNNGFVANETPMYSIGSAYVRYSMY